MLGGGNNLNEPVIVQGTSVPNQASNTPGYTTTSTGAVIPTASGYAPSSNDNKLEQSGTEKFNGFKGESQPKQFNDIFWSILFYAHLVAILILAIAYGGRDGNNGGYGASAGVIAAVVVCGFFSAGLSSLSLGFMMKFPNVLIKTALLFSVATSGIMCLLGLMSGQIMLAVMGGIGFLLGCCYAYFVWDRIPFAAANMNTALTAVKANMGLALVGYLFVALALLWSVWWSVATAGTLYALGDEMLFVMLVSFYWTHQVLTNTMHVTSAGVIGTWWFNPSEASSFCSPAIKDSVVRATTYSFGSICFGSLLVAIVKALRALNEYVRDNEEFQIISCIIDCCLRCIQGILEELNKWAYVYIGLYGYSYLEAGRNVMTLFENKGWTSIITDDLVENVLFMMSVVIGLLTGLVGYIMTTLDRNLFVAYPNPGLMGFLMGFLVGFVMTSVLMSVVGSAVNTVIVCFAEAPNEFQRNHPELSEEMRATWRQAWPVECGHM